MKSSIRVASKVYGCLLRLFPRGFKREFGMEMVGVFNEQLEDAAQAGASAFARTCVFELLDLPVSLLATYLSALGKEIDIQNLSSRTRRTAAILLAALSMGFGWVIINKTYEWIGAFGWMDHLLGDLLLTLAFAFPIVLCGLMLGIVAGVDRRSFLRIGLWTMAGGVAGYWADMPVRFANTLLQDRLTPASGWYPAAQYLGIFTIQATYSLFCAAGLGLAFGGWKACKRFAPFGLLASVLATALASLMTNRIATLLSTGRFDSPLHSLFNVLPLDYLWAITLGLLTGGALGWFLGFRRRREASSFQGNQAPIV